MAATSSYRAVTAWSYASDWILGAECGWRWAERWSALRRSCGIAPGTHLPSRRCCSAGFSSPPACARRGGGSRSTRRRSPGVTRATIPGDLRRGHAHASPASSWSTAVVSPTRSSVVGGRCGRCESAGATASSTPHPSHLRARRQPARWQRRWRVGSLWRSRSRSAPPALRLRQRVHPATFGVRRARNPGQDDSIHGNFRLSRGDRQLFDVGFGMLEIRRGSRKLCA